jgi:hypothetical protein
MKDAGKFYGHQEYISAIWHILRPFGNLHSGNLVDFPPFWYISSTKSGNPDRHTKPSAQLSANNLPFKLNFRRKSSFFTFLIAPKTIFNRAAPNLPNSQTDKTRIHFLPFGFSW